METGARRSVLTAQVLVETTHSTEEEHDRAVVWTAERIKSAPARIRGGYVATQVRTSEGKSLGMAAYGQNPSEDTLEIVNDLFDVPEKT